MKKQVYLVTFLGKDSGYKDMDGLWNDGSCVEGTTTDIKQWIIEHNESRGWKDYSILSYKELAEELVAYKAYENIEEVFKSLNKDEALEELNDNYQCCMYEDEDEFSFEKIDEKIDENTLIKIYQVKDKIDDNEIMLIGDMFDVIDYLEMLLVDNSYEDRNLDNNDVLNETLKLFDLELELIYSKTIEEYSENE